MLELEVVAERREANIRVALAALKVAEGLRSEYDWELPGTHHHRAQMAELAAGRGVVLVDHRGRHDPTPTGVQRSVVCLGGGAL